MLAGGDLDGDLYGLILDTRLHPPQNDPPASYKSLGDHELDRPCTIEDVQDHVVGYFANDLVGIIATYSLLLADVSEKGLRDPNCITLAELHSDAVDFPKTGKNADQGRIPRIPREKPDWHAGEFEKLSDGYYRSTKAIGHLYRDFELPAVSEAHREARRQKQRFNRNEGQLPTHAIRFTYPTRADSNDLLTRVLRNLLEEFVDLPQDTTDGVLVDMVNVYNGYTEQLHFSCQEYSLHPRDPLTEEEAVAGTIVERTTQPPHRRNLIAKLRNETEELVENVRQTLAGEEGQSNDEERLLRTWAAWSISRQLESERFGARSFGLIALAFAFDTVKQMESQENR